MIIRPLLETGKTEIESFLQEKGIELILADVGQI